MHRSIRSVGSLALCLAALGLVACAEERPPVDRVQPQALKKSYFVGANLLDPADDPEFWAQGTLIDVGYGAAQDGLFTSTYAQPLSRVKWVITETMLFGRISYERIAGSDGKGAGASKSDGVIAVAYPITSHFDIQRSYNPTTGEKLNVMEENATDRPWYEREYMRVDWSKNHNVDSFDFDTLSLVGIYGAVKYEPMAFYITDPSDENAPHFDLENGYFDVTNKAFATPEMIDLSSWGWGIADFPSCFLDADFMGGSFPAGNCNPVELTIRQSFRRVDERDYEPQEYDGHRFEAFGAFDQVRYGFARNYGMTDTLQHRFVARYNIWEKSHVDAECYTPAKMKEGSTNAGYDPHRDTDSNGTEDECEDVGGGSRCDTFKQKCTIPFRERTATPIVWYYSTGNDPRYWDGTAQAANEWDAAMRIAVLTARYVECKKTGGADCAAQYPVPTGQMVDYEDASTLTWEVDRCRHGLAYAGQSCDTLADSLGGARGYSAEVIYVAKQPEMIVLCHSPVEAGDPAACAPSGQRLPAGMTAAQCFEARRNADNATLATCGAALNARRGDLRYHQVTVIPEPQLGSPWGIMVDAVDPLNGMKVAASVNVWSYINDLWSQQVVDVSRYIKGELKTTDVTDGKYVRDWSLASEAATGNGAIPPMQKAELDKLLADSAGSSVERIEAVHKAFDTRPDLHEKMAQLKQDLSRVRADVRAPSANKAMYEARRKAAEGTPTEASLVNVPMQDLAGTRGLTDPALITKFASPLRGNNPIMQRDLRQMREVALAERGACIMNEAPAPLGIAYLADQLAKKFGSFDAAHDQSVVEQAERAERMRQWIAQKAQRSVVVHEMGHSIGLRHNFVSSADPLFYRPQYWQLRTNDGTVANVCTDYQADGNCIGPRYFDPVNQTEKDGLIWMWMQSSIMDYPGETTQDLIGLGAWDYASAQMIYGDVVAVFADSTYATTAARGKAMLQKNNYRFGGILGIQYNSGVTTSTSSGEIHYSELQNKFQLIKDCAQVDPNRFRPEDWDEATNGVWSELLDAGIVKVNGRFTRCKQQPVDFVSWNKLGRAKSGAEEEINPPSYEPGTNRVRVPYGFGTDNWADVGNLSVFRHDNGADPYELFEFLITQQEVGHIFDNFRRNRATFSIRGASGRTLERYNEKLRDAAKGLGLMVNVYKDFALAQGYNFDDLWLYALDSFYKPNLLASRLAFDHFTRQMQRPEEGPYFEFGTDPVLRSTRDAEGNVDPAADGVVTVPNGATGYFQNVSFGGRPMENRLALDRGEYNAYYTMNCGSYYDKIYATFLMTESWDNFISDSRRDYVDGRYRAISVADVFPEPYRRWLANNLTGDEFIKGARVTVDGTNQPFLDNTPAGRSDFAGYPRFPRDPIAWTTWTAPGGPEVCFSNATLQCTPSTASTRPLDSQVGWEVQKFLIVWTLYFLPENQQRNWVDEMSLWEFGADSDPGFPNRIEFHNPVGRSYVAKTSGKETIFGKSVQRGVAARMLEYANELLVNAYETTGGDDLDGDGRPDWYVARLNSNGQPIVKYDPTLQGITSAGYPGVDPNCNSGTNSGCTCAANRACVALARYSEMPYYLRQALQDFGFWYPGMKGIY